MTMLRIFIAVELKPEIQNQISKIITELSTNIRSGVKWVPPRNIHLTLKFIGDFPGDQISALGKAISQSIKSIPPFACEIRQLGAFPNRNRPRTIWIGMEESKDLVNLAKRIDEATNAFGTPLEARRFSPHLTIGRVSSSILNTDLVLLSGILARQKVDVIGIQPVQSIAIIKSDLTSTGAIYTILERVSLSKENAL